MRNKIAKTVGLIVIENNKVLMARSEKSGEAFYFVGGAIEENEIAEEAIPRETKEEVGGDVERKTLQFLKVFVASAHNWERVTVQASIYLGRLVGEPKPSTEIVELQYFTYDQGMKNPPELSKIVFAWLKEKGYIR